MKRTDRIQNVELFYASFSVNARDMILDIVFISDLDFQIGIFIED